MLSRLAMPLPLPPADLEVRVSGLGALHERDGLFPSLDAGLPR